MPKFLLFCEISSICQCREWVYSARSKCIAQSEYKQRTKANICQWAQWNNTAIIKIIAPFTVNSPCSTVINRYQLQSLNGCPFRIFGIQGLRNMIQRSEPIKLCNKLLLIAQLKHFTIVLVRIQISKHHHWLTHMAWLWTLISYRTNKSLSHLSKKYACNYKYDKNRAL